MSNTILDSTAKQVQSFFESTLERATERVREFTPTEKIGSLIIGLMLIVAALYLGGSKLTNLRDEFNQQSEKLDELRTRLNLLLDSDRSPITSYLTLRAKRKLMDNALKKGPGSEDDALASIEKFVHKPVGKEQSFIDAGRSQPINDNLTRTSYRINIKTGKLDDVVTVLRHLSDSYQSIAVTSLKLDKNYQKFLNVEIEVLNTTKLN